MSKCCIVKCFPEKRTLLKCCCFNLTYYKIFVLQTIFTVGFHFFDIGSDIAVLVDLNQKKSEYFSLCLMIILLPVIAIFIRSLGTLRRGCNCSCFFKLIQNTIFFILLQGVILSGAFENLRHGRKTQQFVETRMHESLLESAPESLFQLFIILKDATTQTFNQMTIYYSSITLSIFSLIMSLVSYEIFIFNDSRRKEFIRNPIRTIDYSIPFDITEKPIKGNSRYIILLTFYRLTEVLSRVGLLACIGNIYDGYSIIWFLLGDLLLLCLFHSYKVILNCEICCYESDQDDESDSDAFANHIQITLIIILYRFFDRIKSLAVFSTTFLQLIYVGIYRYTLNDSKRDKKDFISNIKYHFISRYLNNTILSILIIYNLSVNTFSYSIFVISISSISSFVLNIQFLYLILKYTYNYKKYQYIFKPIGCCKCRCCCKNIENEIEEKHPEDIII